MKTRIFWLTLITAALAIAGDSHFGLLTVGAIDTARLTAVCDNTAQRRPRLAISCLSFTTSRAPS